MTQEWLFHLNLNFSTDSRFVHLSYVYQYIFADFSIIAHTTQVIAIRKSELADIQRIWPCESSLASFEELFNGDCLVTLVHIFIASICATLCKIYGWVGMKSIIQSCLTTAVRSHPIIWPSLNLTMSGMYYESKQSKTTNPTFIV